MKNQAIDLLRDEKVDLLLGYKMVDGHPLPHCFTKENLDELDQMVTGPARYPLEKMAARIAEKTPDLKIAILARDCNQRALNVLTAWNQISPERIETITLNCCPSSLGRHSDCTYLEPKEAGSYKRQVGIDSALGLDGVESFDQQKRFDRWIYEFGKCIKCYGCRNICPVCFCKECSLEHPDLIDAGAVPPEVPLFHLIRAVHMAGRCVDCGLCEEVCPADIPLRLLYRKVNQIVKDVFNYETGSAPGLPPFSMLENKVVLEPKPME